MELSFPVPLDSTHFGMSVRAYFTAKAMTIVEYYGDNEKFAVKCCDMAEAIIRELEHRAKKEKSDGI